MQKIKVWDFEIANDHPFTLIAGPCLLESENHALMMIHCIKNVCDELGINFIYKSSFDKANRTSASSVRSAVSIDQAMKIFERLRKEVKAPIITDVHTPEQIEIVAPHVDVLQIPAFLCRQTDLLLAAGESGKPINVKKGQFLAPWDMKNVAAKIASTGNHKIMLCERGASFGYNTLVSDMRSLPIMAETGYPVVFDATHSVQQPGGQGTSSGGQREFVPYLAKAAMAVGCAAVFMEVHENPDQAPSDGPNMIHLKDLKPLLEQMKAIDAVVKGY